MISAYTDQTGRRTYLIPQAIADVALEIFPDMDKCSAVFRLARAISWSDAHTLENIAINCSHSDAVDFARNRIERSVLATRRPN